MTRWQLASKTTSLNGKVALWQPDTAGTYSRSGGLAVDRKELYTTEILGFARRTGTDTLKISYKK
jgi:hypothetical protein